MSWLKKVFSSQSLQETMVVYVTSNNESEKYKKDDDPQISKLEIEEENKKSSQGSDNSSLSLWSGLSITFYSPKSKKRQFSADDEEEDQWWRSFSSKKRNESKSKSVFLLPSEIFIPNNKHTNTNLCL